MTLFDKEILKDIYNMVIYLKEVKEQLDNDKSVNVWYINTAIKALENFLSVNNYG